ncbi:hypothetical protein [Streptomyces virginiae]|uniref:hypothetical protein n=1 Tax=Streptomyces virginiae TaxID=1961 RepID=UPI003252B42E
MSAGLTARLARLERWQERRRAEVAALGAEVMALLAALERDDPAGYDALVAELFPDLTPTPERTR